MLAVNDMLSHGGEKRTLADAILSDENLAKDSEGTSERECPRRPSVEEKSRWLLVWKPFPLFEK